MTTTDCLFITGATGFIGRALVPRLRAARPERRITALVRDPERGLFLGKYGVSLVAGDVTRPRMGIGAQEYEELARTVTGIIHAAGDVNFGAALPVSRAANVFGTQQVLNFARACARLSRFAHVSTVTIHGLRSGPLLERPSPHGHLFVNYYQQSKHEAEWLVLRAAREIPAEIFRLSLVAADSVSGEVSQFNYVHHLLRYIPDSPLPAMPGDPVTMVDLIPGDWAASALAFLFDNRFQPGAVRNLSAGPEHALKLAETVDVARTAMEQHRGTTVQIPRFVSAHEFQEIVARSDWRVKEAAAILGPHINLLSARQTFENSRTLAELEGSGLAIPALRSYLPQVVSFCLQTNWGEGAQRWSMIEAPRSANSHAF